MWIRPRVLHVERAVRVAARKWRRRGTAAEKFEDGSEVRNSVGVQ